MLVVVVVVGMMMIWMAEFLLFFRCYFLQPPDRFAVSVWRVVSKSAVMMMALVCWW